MADVSLIVNVQLQEGGKLVADDNPNVVAILTSNQNVLNSNNRYLLFSQSTNLTATFGSASVENAFGEAFFGTSPNPISAGGVLVMGYWRAATETVPASAATLLGEQLSEAKVMPSLQQISDGSFKITVDSTEQDLTGLDFSVTSTLEEVAELINDELSTSAICVVEDSHIKITSATTGATSLLTYASASTSGTDVSVLLGLDSTSSSKLTQGAAESSLDPESKVDALNYLLQELNIKGACFVDDPTDVETAEIASWAQANRVLIYDVFESASNLEMSSSNPVWKVKTSSQTFYRCSYNPEGNRKQAVSMMARQHTANFNGENTLPTLQLKELSTGTYAINNTDTDKAYKVGLDIYPLFEREAGGVRCSPANDFADNAYGMTAFIDAIQKAYFNVLKGTSTKVGQTTKGGQLLVDAVEAVCERFDRAGFINAGEWASPDSFGDLQTFKSSIRTKGYYVLMGSFATQSQALREERVAPVMQVAIKQEGAIHQGSIIVFNNK